MEEIYGRLYEPGEVFELREVIELLENNPQQIEINKKVVQKAAPDIDVSELRKWEN